MSPLREEALLQMRLRGFAPKTVEAYIYAMIVLCRFYMRPLETLTCIEVQRFLDEIITGRKLAWATVNVYFSAYRFLYEQVLKRSKREFSIPPRGRSGKRPGVLSQAEVARLIVAPRSLKHRAILALTYGSGLRVSEVVRVRTKDVDRGRMRLFVGDGKGLKQMPLPCAEFIGRFLLHVLPKGFQKIRAYGWLAPRNKTATLAAIREALGAEPPTPPPEGETAPERVLRLTGVDVTLCPVCKAGRLAFERLLPRAKDGPS